MLDVDYPNLRKFAKATHEFRVYIAANAGSLISYGERYRAGERISSAFVESTVNAVISKRLPNDSRCSGRVAERTCCCRLARAPSTARAGPCSSAGIPDSPTAMRSAPITPPRPERPTDPHALRFACRRKTGQGAQFAFAVPFAHRLAFKMASSKAFPLSVPLRP